MDISNKIADIVREAGKIMTGAARDELNITEKAGAANFVTKYDVAVEDFLYEKLAELLPEAIFIGEESDDNHSELLASSLCFIIDPIDGTTNFIHDYRHSAISVALCSKGEIIAAVVYNPYMNEMFTAEKGEGAYLNGARMYTSSRPLSYGVVAFGTTPYTRSAGDWTFRVAYQMYMASSDIRRSGSAALDLCYLAAGRTEAFFEASLSPWDYAAGSLLITEAGGIITKLDGTPIHFDKPCSIFAGGVRAYADAKPIIEKMLDEE